MKIGIISYGSAVNCYDIAQHYLEETVKQLKKMGHEIKAVSKVVLSDEENKEAFCLFRKEVPELIVIQMGTFAQGNMLLDAIMEWEKIPIFVCGFYDPIVKEHPTIPLNSLTGLTMLTSFLHKIGKKFSYAYGKFEDETIMKKIQLTINAIELKNKLKHSRYLVVGSHVPGFYNCTVDELRFRKEIGPEIIYYSVASLLREAEKIDTKQVIETCREIEQRVQVTVGRTMVEKTVRLELALKNYVKENEINAVTMKCWPELQDLYQCSGCGVLSRLNDSGTVAGCEGDITGLASMDILQKLSKKPVFFADLVTAAQTGIVKAWHCGFGPEKLAKNLAAIEYTQQATLRNGIGVGIQYEMKQGRLSMCKLSEQKEGYQMLFAGGVGVPTDRQLLGVQTDIKLDAGFSKVMDMIIENGFEQHYAIVHEDLKEQLKEFSKWKNIRLFCAD
ncbi:MAG: hypothetical protein RR139_08660 [Lachnospiraceae bacterium]